MDTKNGCDVNLQDNKNKYTPLMALCGNNNIEGVKLLLKHNVNIHLKQSGGLTALDIAVMRNHTKIVSLLCEKTNVN